jgi:hypothetical protein
MQDLPPACRTCAPRQEKPSVFTSAAGGVTVSSWLIRLAPNAQKLASGISTDDVANPKADPSASAVRNVRTELKEPIQTKTGNEPHIDQTHGALRSTFSFSSEGFCLRSLVAC